MKNSITILPKSAQDVQRGAKQCHDPEHGHRSPVIEIVAATIGGISIWIETEQNSGRYNVKAGDESNVNLTERAARAWLAGQVKS